LTRGLPKVITVDNGPEFISKVLDVWAHANGIKLHFIQPGKPAQNAYIESFKGKFRDECLNEHVFVSLGNARTKFQAWRLDYNANRPHRSLNNMTPEEFAVRFQQQKQTEITHLELGSCWGKVKLHCGGGSHEKVTGNCAQCLGMEGFQGRERLANRNGDRIEKSAQKGTDRYRSVPCFVKGWSGERRGRRCHWGTPG
jgi:hypothetical protein